MDSAPLRGACSCHCHSLCPTELLGTGQPRVLAPSALLLLPGDFSPSCGACASRSQVTSLAVCCVFLSQTPFPHWRFHPSGETDEQINVRVRSVPWREAQWGSARFALRLESASLARLTSQRRLEEARDNA